MQDQARKKPRRTALIAENANRMPTSSQDGPTPYAPSSWGAWTHRVVGMPPVPALTHRIHAVALPGLFEHPAPTQRLRAGLEAGPSPVGTRRLPDGVLLHRLLDPQLRQDLRRRAVVGQARLVADVADGLPAVRGGVVRGARQRTEAAEELRTGLEPVLGLGFEADVVADGLVLLRLQRGERAAEALRRLGLEPVEAGQDDIAVVGLAGV